METNRFYNEILTEHNLHPEFKRDLPDADIELAGVNPSCGDEIRLKLKTDGGIITDGAFVGSGCAVSQASADIMLGMVIGRPRDEALHLCELFQRMIRGRGHGERDRPASGGRCPAGRGPHARPGKMRHAGLADAGRGPARQKRQGQFLKPQFLSHHKARVGYANAYPTLALLIHPRFAQIAFFSQGGARGGKARLESDRMPR